MKTLRLLRRPLFKGGNENTVKNILVLGDVVGRCGRDVIFEHLGELISEYSADFTVINGENATTGNGINEKYAVMLLEAGADVITLGNHSFDKKDISHLMETDKRIIRPLNLSPNLPGDGLTVIEKDGVKYAVINILGKTFMENDSTSPFFTLEKAVNRILSKYEDIIIIVDFHAEATSEKQALAYYCEGKVSAFYGTHTHVQTNDARILKGKTGYITDIGMNGSRDSVIGLEKEIGINRFISDERKSFHWGDSEPMINGAVFTVDENTAETKKIQLISKTY